MNETIAVIVVGVDLVIGALLLLHKLLPENRNLLEERPAEYGESNPPQNLRNVELSLPLVDRVMKPLLNSFGNFIETGFRSASLQRTQESLIMAGRPLSLTVGSYLVLRIFCAIAGFLLGIFLVTVLSQSPVFNFLIIIAATVGGYILPRALLERRIRNRQKELRKALPAIIDLLTISIDAGLTFDDALNNVVKR